MTFEYKDPNQRLGLSGRQTGMIAQDVQQVFPEWVDQDEDGYRYVTFRGFEALTVEALRDLRREKDAQIEVLEAELTEVRVEKDLQINELKKRLEQLEITLAKLADFTEGSTR